VHDNDATIRRYWEEVWSAGRFDLADQVYASSFRENADAPSTPAEFAEGAGGWRRHFTDFRVRVDDLFSVGSKVVSRVTFTGRHTADFSFMPARGLAYELMGIDVFEFEDGRVVQHWHAADHLEMFEQIGAKLRPAGS